MQLVGQLGRCQARQARSLLSGVRVLTELSTSLQARERQNQIRSQQDNSLGMTPTFQCYFNVP
jgi:hypothetical protein